MGPRKKGNNQLVTMIMKSVKRVNERTEDGKRRQAQNQREIQNSQKSRKIKLNYETANSLINAGKTKQERN